MPAPSLRTVRRLRSQSVETTSAVFMVSPEAADARQEFSPSRSQVGKKMTRGSGSSERPRFVAMDPHASPPNRGGPVQSGLPESAKTRISGTYAFARFVGLIGHQSVGGSEWGFMSTARKGFWFTQSGP